MSGFIAVHVGAGYHSEKLRPSYKKTCKEACSSAIQMLKDGCHAVEAVAEAVSFLENSPQTNAGIGSNLTLNGTVECDASIMDGSSLHFGSVGSLCNIKNPIKVAQKILEKQKLGLLSCGRVPPCTIVGKGAFDWALENGFEFTSSKELSTISTERSYLKNLHLIEQSNLCKWENSFPEIINQKSSHENILMDTVGAVCVDSCGNVSSAVSSGGLLLKHSGRIGQAAMYGSGCWAENSSVSDRPSIACSVTGVGEYLIKTLFAKECHQMMFRNHDCVTALADVFRLKFLDSPYLKNIDTKLAGVLTVKYYSPDNICELAWAHNTRTMVIGYMSTIDTKAFSVVSEQPRVSVSGKSIVGSEKCIRLNKK